MSFTPPPSLIRLTMHDASGGSTISCRSSTGASAGTLRSYLQQLDTQIGTLKEASQRKTTPGDEPTPAWLSLALGGRATSAAAELDAAEKRGFRVSPNLRRDVRDALVKKV